MVPVNSKDDEAVISSESESNQITNEPTKRELVESELVEELIERELIEIKPIERCYRGFDVISQKFFVRERSLEKETKGVITTKEFDNFEDYYDYLNGDIYDKACYYQCDFSKVKREIDRDKIYKLDAFAEECIDDYKNKTVENFNDSNYEKGECTKKVLKEWVAKFLECNSFEELLKTAEDFLSTGICRGTYNPIGFFIWQYIFYDVNDKQRFEIVMRYVNSVRGPATAGISWQTLCHIYNPNDVFEAADFSNYAKSSRGRAVGSLKRYIEELDSYNAKRTSYVVFDYNTHYYVETDSNGVNRYFETFEELLEYRNNDLRNAHLQNAIKLKYDFSKCIIDETTQLPKVNEGELKFRTKKEYSNGSFFVHMAWFNTNNVCVNQTSKKFTWFFDFVKFLKHDLSNADLLSCDGLKYLTDVSDINFTNTLIKSSICDQIGISYERIKFDEKMIGSFKSTEENENSTSLEVYDASREMALNDRNTGIMVHTLDNSQDRIMYISDLHLIHKFDWTTIRSRADRIYVIRNIVSVLIQDILREKGNYLLIGGDTSSVFDVFELFVKILSMELRKIRPMPEVIFVLGNHELWQFPGLQLHEIVNIYESLLAKHGMYLLQNEILYKDSHKLYKIKNSQLDELSALELKKKLSTAQSIFFGGIGFSKYNSDFNATNGIYRGTISRNEEIKEGSIFERLYDKVVEVFPERKIVICTHTPMDCWKEKESYHKNYVYLSGHTHRNFFFDDGETRVYADNQVGYKKNTPHLKWLDIDLSYDYFSAYEDGIHKITSEDYIQFNRSKNIHISFNRKINILYMLKKRGYYCFIHESTGGSLTILNGGSLKKLTDSDQIEYYYDNMDFVISMLKDPLDKYTEVQEQIAMEIKKIGGIGIIHGCIIDIDFYNHVYVNPIDLKITGYWAENIFDKKIYQNIPMLLQNECPALYSNYLKLIGDNKANSVSIFSGDTDTDVSVLPQEYLETDIYKASREINKIQRLHSNVLTTWFTPNRNKKMIE